MCKVNTGIVTLIINNYKNVHFYHIRMYTFAYQDCTLLPYKNVQSYTVKLYLKKIDLIQAILFNYTKRQLSPNPERAM